jgi:hypothetical protein
VLLAIAALRKWNYVHGDISVNNILIDDTRGTKVGLRNGLLVDFDHAIPNDGEDGRTVRIGCYTLDELIIQAIDIPQGTIPYMAIELLTELKSVKHEFYHDLESLFYVICYICCICAGPNYTLRDDLKVFETAIAKWFGTKEQSESDIGKEKYETVSIPDDFEEMILHVFHPYFEPLKPYMLRLRDIAIPPHRGIVSFYRRSHNISKEDVKSLPLNLQPMNERGDEQLSEYREILQELFDSLPGDGPQPNSPKITKDYPGQRTSPSTETEDLDTAVDGSGARSTLGKRKHEVESDDDRSATIREYSPPSSSSMGKRRRDLNIPLCTYSSSGDTTESELYSDKKTPELEGIGEIPRNVRRLEMKHGKRRKAQEETEG